MLNNLCQQTEQIRLFAEKITVHCKHVEIDENEQNKWAICTACYSIQGLWWRIASILDSECLLYVTRCSKIDQCYLGFLRTCRQTHGSVLVFAENETVVEIKGERKSTRHTMITKPFQLARIMLQKLQMLRWQKQIFTKELVYVSKSALLFFAKLRQ